MDLAPNKLRQRELDFQNGDDATDRGALTTTLEAIYGRETVLRASAGLEGDREGLVYEAGAADSWVHDLLGGYAGRKSVA